MEVLGSQEPVLHSIPLYLSQGGCASVRSLHPPPLIQLCGRSLGGCSDNSYLQGEPYTHISDHSLRNSLRKRALNGEWVEAGISMFSGIFLPLPRGISGDIHKTRCSFSSCCSESETLSWLVGGSLP